MNFLDDISWLLPQPKAQQLYHEIAKHCPIIDFHTHLDPERFAKDEPFADFSELWIAADPYKWRAMRMNGIPERVITGEAEPVERFRAWAETLLQLPGNPLFEWSHLELRRFFGIDDLLTPDSAGTIHEEVNRQLRMEESRPRALLRRGGVETVVTSDQWLDSLNWHRQAAREEAQPSMLPSLRSDQALDVEAAGFRDFIAELSERTGVSVDSLDSYLAALDTRLDAFAEVGCRLADHGIDELFFEPCSQKEAEASFKTALDGESLDPAQAARLKTHLLIRLCAAYAKRGWTLQLHLGAQRETSTRLAEAAGKAGGYACIGSSIDVRVLARLLDAMEQDGALPRTILYPLNPSDYEMMGSLLGSFAEDGVPGKLQLGPAWWFNDHRAGIERQLEAVSAYGLLGRFIGMVTDSRSYLSSVRHEVFRRLLCSRMGAWVEAGQLPDDDAFLRETIENISHRNARRLI